VACIVAAKPQEGGTTGCGERPPPPPCRSACEKECCEAAFLTNLCETFVYGWNEVEAK